MLGGEKYYKNKIWNSLKEEDSGVRAWGTNQKYVKERINTTLEFEQRFEGGKNYSGRYKSGGWFRQGNISAEAPCIG